jgi:hypothetical protein
VCGHGPEWLADAGGFGHVVGFVEAASDHGLASSDPGADADQPGFGHDARNHACTTRGMRALSDRRREAAVG